MMPDLGEYATWVLGSYLASAALVAGLVALSFWQSARVKRALEAVEGRQGTTDV